ncbi:glycosyltransferase [Bacillus sp. CMF12]|uniref:glycosyltransferase family 2 protein n=1 Tax=Bacillaceae TaxID=186817 RepID=UPI001FB39A97|nr:MULTISPECIES: glycosyltransferase family 2 protein [Bacillaceae]MDF2040259.1 glycosyltransferase family 2 protein [Cytobacillus oceanisediminis]UOE55909.1 glycosyltransferase family 2 protein [Cytobacillus oceanisediminis]USK50369.1 glycosyltransferase [Bacillus sp. CMF12]
MFISVVMSVYNTEKYVKQAVDSILLQTHKNFEFIIINDGSTDNTRKILDTIEDNRVNIIHLEKNHGVAYARNLGVQAAKGEWIAVQDADDISMPSRLEKQAEFIESHPHVIAVGSKIECISGKPAVSRRVTNGISNFHNSLLTNDDLLKERFRSCPLSHGSCIFSKKAFETAGRYDSKYRLIQDYDLWLRMFNIGSIEIVPEVLYLYRVHQGSLTNHSRNAFCIEMNQISMKYICKFYFGQKVKKPIFIVFGPKQHCKIFRDHVVRYGKFKIHQYVSFKHYKDYLDSSYQKFRNETVDGIIVLDPHKGPECKETLSYLESKGMNYNQNLFSLYNILEL